MQLQFLQRLRKIVLTGQAETMNRAITVLTKKNLVEIGFENILLGIMQLKQYRHHGFKAFTNDVAITVEVKILHQLLGESTPTLTQTA